MHLTSQNCALGVKRGQTINSLATGVKEVRNPVNSALLQRKDPDSQVCELRHARILVLVRQTQDVPCMRMLWRVTFVVSITCVTLSAIMQTFIFHSQWRSVCLPLVLVLPARLRLQFPAAVGLLCGVRQRCQACRPCSTTIIELRHW